MYENAFTPLEPLDNIGEAPPLPDAAAMLEHLYADDTQLRMRAARAFCDLEEPKAIDRLIELLGDECVLVRVSAAYALGRNSAPRAVEPLMRALQFDWNGYVRKGAVWALGNAGDTRALPVLVDGLRNDITAVRLWSASALGQVIDEIAVEPLVAGLQSDPIAAVRSNCAWSLGRALDCLNLEAGTPAQQALYRRAIAVLIAALQQDDEGLREDARDALQKLADAEGLAAIAELDDDLLMG
ncbi:HEAT repeat domain-containing protein [Synechococcus sp. PCC 7336]|uniref:HEAT repeat domain-containing protein n=1 Tax=Synechococcus sp. PCC 7336 TaxID=195250 RepID=UPI000348131D|nr:HEAT repeat domain-containing protein [Synechococcus sp. PCC 7336]